MDELSMNPDGKWLELNDDGTVTIFLTEESDEAEWKLEGENFTMTIAGKTVGTGKLQGNELILEMMGMEYDFVREGASAEQAGAENTAVPSPPLPAMETCTRSGIPPISSIRMPRGCQTSTRRWHQGLDHQAGHRRAGVRMAHRL